MTAVQDRRILFSSHLYRFAFSAWQQHQKHLNPPLRESVKCKTHVASSGSRNKASACIKWGTQFSYCIIVENLVFCNGYEGTVPGDKWREERCKKIHRIFDWEKDWEKCLCSVSKRSRAAVLPWTLIACLLWHCFDSHGYSSREISETRWGRLERKNMWSTETGKEIRVVEAQR